MHADQVDVGVAAVEALVRSQFPAWAGLPVRPVASDGTVNALFRLGDELVARLPLQPGADPRLRETLAAEQALLRRIAPLLPVAVPEPVALGAPGPGYAGPWTVYRWIEGLPAGAAPLVDEPALARQLAGFVRALQQVPVEGGTVDPEGRGGPLAAQAQWVADCLADADALGLVDAAAVAACWRRCLAAPAHDAAPVRLHADLMPGNLLVRDGRLAAVIDFGGACVGDPAVELMPAWTLFGAAGRRAYRQALGVDDATWERGRGWALVQGIGALAYYVETNPAMSRGASRTLAAVLEPD